ncbi:hypothetical protein SGLAM104S_10539 [Streptomyces glaucescens]
MKMAAAAPSSQHSPTENTVNRQVVTKDFSSASPMGALKSTAREWSEPGPGSEEVLQSRM